MNGPKVAGNRRRAVFTAAGLLGALTITVLFVPFPYSIRATGVLQANDSTVVHTASEAVLLRVAVPSGTMLKQGDLIAELRNPELDYEYEMASQQVGELEVQYRQSLGKNRADSAPLEQRLAALATQMADIERLRGLLTVRAPHARQVGGGRLAARTQRQLGPRAARCWAKWWRTSVSVSSPWCRRSRPTNCFTTRPRGPACAWPASPTSPCLSPATP